MTEIEDKYYRKLKLFNESIWENRVPDGRIRRWLGNFSQDQRIGALYLLTQFVYFSKHQIDVLLTTLYRDLFMYNRISRIREQNEHTLDERIIFEEYKKILNKTRFVSFGNPSESSASLLMQFRQLNDLPVDLFISSSQIDESFLASQEIEHFVFIDDLCGSGSQGIDYSKQFIPEIKEYYPQSEVSYLMLVSTINGKRKIRNNADFDHVDSVFELDDSFKCFDPSSRTFINKDDCIETDVVREFCEFYGYDLMRQLNSKIGVADELIEDLSESNKFGFGDGQLLLGFHHNTPDNTMPIFWMNEQEIDWFPIFKRFNKVYL